ncbi:hypothetical protein [Plasmodium yoelii yoelii]|uniref:Uncharacterized protein n=1 Tax=Plasmodium yoelii yoelii TaxID=73239 RepID=Q7RLE1_PLAYO|nr:hypothetical protein [Plasmodium yoelii yoelii]
MRLGNMIGMQAARTHGSTAPFSTATLFVNNLASKYKHIK